MNEGLLTSLEYPFGGNEETPETTFQQRRDPACSTADTTTMVTRPAAMAPRIAPMTVVSIPQPSRRRRAPLAMPPAAGRAISVASAILRTPAGKAAGPAKAGLALRASTARHHHQPSSTIPAAVLA